MNVDQIEEAAGVLRELVVRSWAWRATTAPDTADRLVRRPPPTAPGVRDHLVGDLLIAPNADLASSLSRLDIPTVFPVLTPRRVATAGPVRSREWAGQRQKALPRGPPTQQVAALLASCDLCSANGLRDRAILTLLARMGLRSGEVAGLRLDDLDWRPGEIVVRGKGGHVDRLPLPTDVGQALVAYLKAGRPSDALDRRAFVRVKAPHRGLTSGGVTQVVNAAAHRAGLGTIYAHWLRHSAATGMLAAGSSLTEIGQVP